MATVTGDAERGRGVQGLAKQANPAFAAGAVAIPVLALAGALATNDLTALTYVHVMAGVLWTGIDLFMGLVLGPVLGGLEPDQRAGFFATFTPKMTFLMPVLAMVTITGGITLASRWGDFTNATPWLALMTAAILIPVVVLVGWQFDALTSGRTLGVLAVVALGAGGWVATTLQSIGAISHWILAALVVVTVLSIIGFGVILPGEVRIYRQLVSGIRTSISSPTSGCETRSSADCRGCFSSRSSS
ncbi:hypothetical protein VB773_11975 [Haloarculaceae archaeon H-GB2-1]|nr:hypothetical protein [Haloarculaceae archaeon H-GB2-1]